MSLSYLDGLDDDLSPSAAPRPSTSPPSADEAAFRSWYADQARRWDLDPNPDDPRHHYDYRAAYRAGATPDESGHWPSQWKADDHPNRVIDGVDTKTGRRVNGTGNGHGRLPPNAQAVGSYLDLLNSSLDADLDEEVAPTLPWEDPTNPLVELAARGQALPTPANQPRVDTPPPVLAAAGEAVRTGALGAARALGEGVVAIPRNIGTTIRALGEQATARAGMPTELAPNVEIPGDPLTTAVRQGLGTALTGVGGALESTFTPTPPDQLPLLLQRDEAMAREALETLQGHPASRFATDVLRQAPQLASTVALASTPGGQSLALGALGAQSGGAAYAEAEQAGATQEQAMGAMVGHGLAEGLAERLPLGNLMKLIGEGGTMKPVRRALGEVLKQAGMEFTQEALTSVAQRAVDLATYKGERGEAFTVEDLANAAYEGGLGAAMGGVSAAMAVRGAGEPPVAVPTLSAPTTPPPAARTQPAVAPTTPPPRSVFAQPVRGGEVIAAPPQTTAATPPPEQAQPPVAEAGEAVAGTPVAVPVDEAPPPLAVVVQPEQAAAPTTAPPPPTTAPPLPSTEATGQYDAPAGDQQAAGDSASSPAPIERRTDLATRRRVADMSPADMARTLLTDELTGLGNRRAYEEAGYDQQNAQASVDLDSLKWINDNLGHDQGDEVLRKVGRAFQETGVPGFRFGGDEFRVAAENDEDLDAYLRQVSDHLRSAGPLTYRAPDGTTYSVPVELTYGTATGSDAFAEADRQLIAAKAQREARGERAGRGEKPPGVVVEPAAGGQVGVAGERGVGVAEKVVERKPARLRWSRGSYEIKGEKKSSKGVIEPWSDKVSGVTYGAFGVHPTTMPGGKKAYALTHLTSGLALGRPGKLADQRAAAERLQAGAPELVEWDGRKETQPPIDAMRRAWQVFTGALEETPQREEVVTPDAPVRQEGSAQAQAAEAEVSAAPVTATPPSAPRRVVIREAEITPTRGGVVAKPISETVYPIERTDTRAAVEPTQPPAAVEPVPVTATAPNEQSSAPAAAVRETPAVVQRTPTPAPTAPAEAPTTRPDRRSEVIGEDSLDRQLVRASERLRKTLEQSVATGGVVTVTADNLMNAVAEETGGSLAAGTFTAKDAYDALDLAVNTRIASRGKADARAGTSLIDAKTRILALDEASSRLPTQTRRTGESDSFQQFSTPPAYAYLANWAAALTPDDVYLEPSAGTGGLLSVARASGVKTIYANELAPRRAHMLAHPDLGVERVFRENAEQLDNALPADVQPTVVVMNPPFSQTAGRMGDKVVAMTGAIHVEQALKRLAPGGRLVAIVGGGRSRDNDKATGGMRMDAPGYRGWWSRIKSQYSVRANVGIPGSVYRKHGTVFHTRLLVIDKTGPTTGPIETADATSLIHALAILEEIRDDRQSVERPTAKPTTSSPPTPPAAKKRTASRTESTPTATAPVAAPAKPEAAPTTSTATTPIVAAAKVEEEAAPRAEVTSTALPSRTSTGELTDSIYEPYRPARLRIPGAPHHPTALVESAAMSSVDPPPTSYVPSFTRDFIERGGPNGKPPLSLEQLEFTVYAGEAHSQMLPAVGDVPARRRGIMGGDGTGAGKGRQVASVILDNWNQGRRKAVWVSEKQRLIEDARRDWTALGGRKRDIISNKQVKADGDIQGDQGIFFTTYDTLRGKPSEKAAKAASEKGKVAQSRVDQLVDWLGADFDGVIVFDESHNMGNAVDTKGGRGTKQASQKAKAGMELQDRLPNARVIYMSATAATEVANLAYADRLGLWGPGTAFGDRKDFVTKIEAGGVGIMEAVARDLKALGSYVARSLAFSDGTELGTVQYARQEHELTADQVEVYNVLADAWQVVLDNVHLALEETTGDKGAAAAGRAKASAMSAFWGANQRFFNQVLTSMQMPLALREMKRDLEEGRSVVVQLVNTLEASQERQLAARAEDEDLEEFDLTPRDQLMEYIKKSFPTTQLEEYEDEKGNVGMRPVRDSKGDLVENRAAAKLRDSLLDKLAMIRVPQSPLDMVIEQLGGPSKVAEVTGRGRRLVRNAEGRMVIEPRSSSKNQADVAAFQDGKKRVLIFTAAGGTGASYHASNEVNNRERRVHYLLQAGWRADQALQGFGRTHRTDQASAPIYKLISTNLPGHRRFISSIARRLDQLGALTSGQRETARRGVFAEKDNLEGRTASDALRLFYYDVIGGKVEGLSLAEFTAQTGLRLIDSDGKPLKLLPPITQFLNRLLSMRTTAQETTFRAFEQRWDAVTEIAIQRGELDVGTETIRGEKVEKLEDRTVYTHPTGADTRYVKLRIWRRTSPVSYEVAARKAGAAGAVVAKAEAGRGYRSASETAKGEFAQNRKTGRLWAVVGHATRTDESGKVETVSRMVDPSGAHLSVTNTELYRLYETTTPEQAKGEWEKQVAAVPSLYPRDEHMLVGVLLPIWDRISSESKKVYRLRTDDGEVLLGRSIDPPNVSATLKALGAGASTLAPEQAVERLMEGDVKVELSNRWKLERARVANEWRLELKVGADNLYARRQELEAIGLFLERHDYSMRVFVPTGERAVEVYKGLTRLYPVADVVEMGSSGRGDEGGGGGGADAGAHGHGEDSTTDGGNEGGFIKVGPLVDLMHWARRHFTSMGLRPASLDDAMVRMKAAVAARANRIDAIARDVEALKKKYKGPLTRKQLDTYLDDALRGMNLRTGAEALDERQIARIAAARGVAPEALRERLAERVPLAWAGLRHAPQFAPLLREMRDLVDATARDLRRAGLLDDANARELERHYGLYVHRQYEAVRNPKFAAHMKDSPLWGRAVELTQAKFPNKPQAEIEGWLLTYVDRAKAQPNGRVLLPGGTPEGAQDLSPLRQRTDLEDLKRLLLGEVRGATSNFVTTASLMARLVEEQRFLDEVAEVGLKEGWLTKKPTSESGVDTIVQIDPTWRGSTEKGKAGTPEIGEPPGLDRLTTHRSKDRTSPVGGLFTTKDVYDELMGTYDHDAVPRWLEWYMRTNWFVKWGATAGSIQGANRNFISNFLYVLANGVNPLNPSRFLESGALAYPRVFGNTERERLAKVEKFIRLGLMDQGTDVGDLKRMETEAQQRRTDNPRVREAEAQLARGLRLSSDFYQAPDNFAKIFVFDALYPSYRRALPSTMTDEQVDLHLAGVLRRTMQNYGAVPRGIRTLSARVPTIAPFLSFGEEVVRNVKNIGLVSVEEMRSGNPGLQRIAARRVAGTIAALSLPAFTTFVIRWLLNTDPEDDDHARRFVPPWSRNADLTVLPSAPGTLSYVDWGFMDTFAQLKQPFYALARGDVDGAAYALNRSFGEEILFGALMDVRANEKPTGGDIYNPQDTWGARQLSKLKYIGRVAEPGTARSAQRVYESTQPGSPKVLWQELLALGGPRVTTIDLKLAVEIHGRQFMEDARDARQLELRPKVGSQERGGEKAAASLQEAAEGMATDLVAARGLGVSEEELRSAMSAAQVPQWAQDALLNGEIQDVVDHYRDLNRERMEEEADEGAID